MLNWLIFASTLSIALSVNNSVHAATLTIEELSPHDLLITEYMANPVNAADSSAEYFELFNATNQTVDLTGMVIRDDGSNSFTVSGLSIPALGFAVFSNGMGTELGHPVDYSYGNAMSLTNTDDEIGLYRPDDQLIHKVAYDDGDFFGAGVAHELATATDAALISVGPAAGMAYIAASSALLLNNFGSPGTAGNTEMNLAAVPLPASVWMFGSALSILGWARRQARLAVIRNPEGCDHATVSASVFCQPRIDSEFGSARSGSV